MGIDERKGEKPPDVFSAQHYEAIGRLVVACSRLDAIFTDLICCFTGLSSTNGLILVHHQTFSSKYDAFIAVLRELGKSSGAEDRVIDHYASSFTVVKEAYNYRNKIVHGLWSQPSSGHPEVQRFAARGKLQKNVTAFPTEEILKKADEVMAGCDNLLELREKILRLHPTSDQECDQSDPSRLG